ncbi:MAG: hypothetical protein WCK14_04250 [Actinomycetota bacterium]
MSNSDISESAAAATRQQAPSCASCGSHLATQWGTSEGRAWLCRECATLHGLGCP